MVTYINCSNCGKEIIKKGVRTMCVHCRNLADHIRQEQIRQMRQQKKESKK